MAVNVERLLSELQSAAGLSSTLVSGTAVVAATHRADTPVTFHQRPPASGGELVRVTWASEPTAQQQTQANTVVLAHDGAKTESEKLDDEVTLRQGRVLAALLVRASSHWAGLSAQRRNRVMAIIDDAAAKLVQLLS